MLSFRAWVACAAVGAGLIHLALVVDALLPIGSLLAVVGIAEFGWGVLAIFDARFLVPRIALGAALVPVGLWIAALLLGQAPLPLAPLAAATVLDFAIAVLLAIALRRPEPRPVPRGRVVAAVVLGALVVAAITVPALLATRGGGSVPASPLIDNGGHH